MAQFDQLIIAEKKEVAKAISDAMGGKLASNDYFESGETRITWLSGHYLRLQDPNEYDEDRYGKWNMASLPMEWPIKHVPIEQHKARLERVVELIKNAKQAINAGDPDSQGQYIVDEVLNYANNKSPELRLLINDNNEKAVKKALANMKPNSEFKGLSDAALAGSVADQRYGYNLTRACTIKGREKGLEGVLSLGRVQTPILGLVVARDKLKKAHKRHVYFVVEAQANVSDISFKATYQVKGGDIADDKNRLTNKEQAEEIASRIKGGDLTILTKKTEDKKKQPPLPYNLIALQADCSGLWGYSPKRVLEITQNLRDQHRCITYNRTESRHLNEERHEEAPELLEALSRVFDEAKGADSSLKSAAFNDSHVTAHHGIIPTLSVPEIDDLSEEEARIYDLISKQYIAQFYPPETYRITTLSLESPEGDLLQAKGRVNVDAGWKVVFKGEALDEEGEEKEVSVNLEPLNEGDKGIAEDCKAIEKRTSPPPHYTMKTLLLDLTKVARYVKDPEIKKLLLEKDAGKKNESGGIGTAATRDSHIETLFKRNYIMEEGKYIVSTSLGVEFHDTLPSMAVQPDLTALWHQRQLSIESGEIDYLEFLQEVDLTVKAEVERIRKEGLDIKVEGHNCPTCNNSILSKRKGSNGVFWGCRSYPTCKATFPDKSGKPDTAPKKKAKVEVSDHLCPKCEKGLVRRPAKKKGTFWWGCSGFPACKFTTFDNNGSPKESKEKTEQKE